MRNSPRRRAASWRRWLAVIGLALLCLLGTGFVVLRVKFEGPDLGDNIASLLNSRMRGRIEIGSIEWDVSQLKKAITGGWVPITIRHVRVWDDCALSQGAAATDELRAGDPNEDCTPDEHPDPDPTSKRRPRKLLLRTELVTAEIDIHALMFGNHDFVFRNVWVHGGEALIEQTEEPYPLHAYDRVIVSIVTAFYPRMGAGFRAGIYADTVPPIFDLRDIHVENLNLTIHMNPYDVEDPLHRIGYATTARIENVNVDAGPEPKNDSYLYMDPVDPLISKFYVRLSATAQKGVMRILDRGPRSAFVLPDPTDPLSQPLAPARDQAYAAGRENDYEVGLTDIKVDRLAQLPTEWARKDFVANTLELDISAKTVLCPTEEDASPDPKHEKGALVHVTGELHNYWDRPYDGSWNLTLDGKNLGPTIRTCIKASVGGDDLNGTITATGPFVAQPKVGLALKNLDFDIPLNATEEPLRLTLAEVQGSIDLVNEVGTIDKTTALIRGGKEPGEVVLSANFGLKPYNARAHVEITNAIDLGRFLPKTVVNGVGKFLQGRLSAIGDDAVGFALEDFDLALGATPKERAIRVHKGRLFTNNKFDTILIQHVIVDAGASHAEVNGTYDVTNAEYEKVEIVGDFPDVDVWLKRFGLPPAFKSAGGGKIVLDGPIKNPKVNVTTTLGGVPCLDKVSGSAEYQNDIVELSNITSAGLGGSLTGKGRLNLSGATPFIERLHLDGRKLDASKLCGLKGTVKGTVDSLDVDMAGSLAPKSSPLDWLDLVEVEAKAEHVSVLGDPYSNLALCVNRKSDATCRPRTSYLDEDDLAQCDAAKRDRKRGAFCAVATATRDHGGMIDATVAKLPPASKVVRNSVAPPAKLDGTIALSDLPISIIDMFTKTHPAGGLVSATLHLSGTPTAPTAEGAVQLLRTWLAGSFVGDAQLAVSPTTLGKVPALAIHGTALAGRLQISGTIGTEAPYPVELVLSGRRIELDTFIDFQKRFDLPEPVQGWASGTVTVKTELAPARPVEPEVWVELSELRAIVTHRSTDGRAIPLVLNAMCRTDINDPEQKCAFEGSERERIRMSLLATPSSLEFACKDANAPSGRVACGSKLATPAGVVIVKGYARPKGMAIEANGTLELSQLQPLFDTMLDKVNGKAKLNVLVKGTFEKPDYEASLALENIEIKLLNNDTVLQAQSGLVKLANGSLGFTGVTVRIRDERKDGGAGELHLKGNIALDGLTPTNWGVLIDGKIAGEMLMLLAPGSVAQATGVARIEGDLQLTGKGPRPNVVGTVLFDQLAPCVGNTGKSSDGDECRPPSEQPLSLFPRGVRREIQLTQGAVDIETVTVYGRRAYRVAVKDVGALVSGEGTFRHVQGSIEVGENGLSRMSIGLNAEGLPFRLPDVPLDLIVTANNVSVSKDGEDAKLQIRGDIEIIDGSYRRNFEIADNIRSIGTSTPPAPPVWIEYPTLGSAELHLTLRIQKFTVRNNIAEIDLDAPKLDITNTPRDPRVDGAIKVSGGRFRIPGTRAPFEDTTGTIKFQSNEAINPELDITSKANYRDLSGQDHVITLRIFDKLDRLQWDLRTSTGYNKSQTLSLLVLGKNPEQLQHSFGNQTLGADPTRGDPSTNPSQSFADQIVKDLAGDWVSGLIGDSLSRLTGLDVLRIEISFGSIGVHVEKKLLDNLKILGNQENTIRGSTITGRAELKTPSRLSVQAGYLNKSFNDPAEQDIVDYTAKVVYHFTLFIP